MRMSLVDNRRKSSNEFQPERSKEKQVLLMISEMFLSPSEKIKKVRLISNCLGFGPCPEPDEEIEQHLTVTSDGRVWFSGYGLLNGSIHKLRTAQSKIEPKIGAYIVQRIADRFSQEYEEEIVMDVGSWELELTNTEGHRYRYRGPLCEVCDKTLGELSELIRYHLGFHLFAFDGDAAEDQVERIEIEYHRNTKIKPKAPISETIEYAVWDYRESFVIDRASETITYKRTIGSGCDVTTTYHVEQGVREFLNDLDAVDLFSTFPEEPKDVIEDPLEKRSYTITVDFVEAPQTKLVGDFDRDSLPNDWADFAERLMDFISFYMGSEVLDPKVFDKPKRRNNALVFCSVEFESGGRTYYYLADEDIYEAGDRVIVPVRSAGEIAVVEIVRVEYFMPDVAPFPLDRMKHIIRKVEDDEDLSIFCPVLERLIGDDDCMEICDVADELMNDDVIKTFDPPVEWSEEKAAACRDCKYHCG